MSAARAIWMRRLKTRRATGGLKYLSDELPDAFACADIMLSRAGSNSLSELMALCKPALLIPYHSGRGDQVLNANSLKARGLAHVMPQSELTAESLPPAIDALGGSRAAASAPRRPAGRGRHAARSRPDSQIHEENKGSLWKNKRAGSLSMSARVSELGACFPPAGFGPRPTSSSPPKEGDAWMTMFHERATSPPALVKRCSTFACKRARLYRLLGAERLGDVFAYVSDAGKYLRELPQEQAADIVEAMDADDAVDALETVSPNCAAP